MVLEHLGKQIYLTPLEEKLLQIIEQECEIADVEREVEKWIQGRLLPINEPIDWNWQEAAVRLPSVIENFLPGVNLLSIKSGIVVL